MGIRGFQKNQRFGTWIAPSNCELAVTPQQALTQLSQLSAKRRQLKSSQTLVTIQPLLKDYQWGVGGSLEYQLVTGIEMAREDSDVDIIMALPEIPITRFAARVLIERLHQIAGAHADIQVVFGQYGFSLEEYALATTSEILVKTAQGPILCRDPWQLSVEMDETK